jgi:hypothetical protein
MEKNIITLILTLMVLVYTKVVAPEQKDTTKFAQKRSQ